VPVIVVISQRLSDDDYRRLSAAKTVLSKSALTREGLRSAIASALAGPDAIERAS
jgi:hypothetical protein